MTEGKGCADRVAQVWDLLDGVLEEAEEARLREHLEACTECAGQLEQVQRLHSGLQSIGRLPEPPIPERIGSYRILRQIGVGGMGIVYEAEQRAPVRSVALKVIRPDGTAQESRLRAFRREIEALGRLRHPWIATVHDAGQTEDGQLFLVMELVEGETLDRYCRTRGIDTREKVDLVARVAEAVQHAHGKGIVHRDLKPANVLVEPDGTPRVLDFGLARFVDPLLDITRSASVTLVGSPAGTLPYISPEQLLGKSRGPGVQDDVYAIGVILYQLVTGRLPYDLALADSVLEAERIIARSVPAHPKAIDRTIPVELGEVMAKAIAREPSRRYASAADLAFDLRAFLAGRPVTARPPGAVRRASSWMARHRRALLTVGAFSLAVVAARQLWPGDPVVEARHSSTHFEIPHAARSYSVYGSQVDFTADGRFAVHRLDRDPDHRTGGIAIWDRSTGTSRPLAFSREGRWEYHSPRWSPDERSIALLARRALPDVEQEFGVFVFDRESDRIEEIATIDRPVHPHDLCWTPDGKGITFVTRDSELYDLTLEGEWTRWPVSTSSSQWELGGYSPDGRWLLFHALAKDSGSGKDLWVMPTRGGLATRLTSTRGHEVQPTFAPDGGSVWYVATVPGPEQNRPSQNVHRIGFDSDTGRAIEPAEQVTFLDSVRIQDLSFVGDGEDLVYRVQHPRSEIRLLMKDPASPTDVRVETLARGLDPVPSLDGTSIYFHGHIGDRSGLFRIAVDGSSDPEYLTDQGDAWIPDRAYHLSPRDGSLTVAGNDGGGHGVWVAGAAELGRDPAGAWRKLAATDNPVWPRWSPDGSTIAWIDGSELVFVDVASGEKQRAAPSIWGWEHWTIRWSPDGKAILAVAYETPTENENGSNSVFLITWPGREVRRLTPRRDGYYMEGVDWHPSGDFITAVGEDSDHRILEIHPDGSPPEVLFEERDHCEYFGTWTPDGRRFVYSCVAAPGCNGIHVYDRETGTVVHEDHPFEAPPTWDPSGRVAVWTSRTTSDHFEWLHGVR